MGITRFEQACHGLTRAFVHGINRLDGRLVIFLTLSLYHLRFTLTGNEEAYFALARQYVDPGWIRNSWTFTEFPGTRLLFQFIAGNMLKVISFEQLSFLGREAVFLLSAFPLARIFRFFRIPNIDVFCLFTIFLFLKQSFFAHEWIFGGFEAKTIAYVFVFYAFYYLFVSRVWMSLFFLIAASCFHILVGGWSLAAVMVILCLEKKEVRTSAKLGAVYMLAMSPFILYLGRRVILDSPGTIEGVSLDWIYVYYRNAHHVGLFKSFEYFIGEPLHGVLHALFWLGVCLFYFRRIPEDNIRLLNRANLGIFVILFTALALAPLDRNGTFLKFYPFRLASLSMFFILVQAALWIRYTAGQKEFPFDRARALAGSLAVMLCVFILLRGLNFALRKSLKHHLKRPPLVEMTGYIQRETPPESLIYRYGVFEKSFARRALRDIFVDYKFVPAGGAKLYEWYTRVRSKERVYQDFRLFEDLRTDYGLDYLLTGDPIPWLEPRLEHENGAYFLYRLE